MALSAPDNVAASGFRWPSAGPAERSLTFHKHLRVHSCTAAQNNPIETLITAYFNSANTKYILSCHPYENQEKIFWVSFLKKSMNSLELGSTEKSPNRRKVDCED